MPRGYLLMSVRARLPNVAATVVARPRGQQFADIGARLGMPDRSHCMFARSRARHSSHAAIPHIRAFLGTVCVRVLQCRPRSSWDALTTAAACTHEGS